MAIHNLTLDISKKLTTHKPLITRVEDSESCVIVATILSNGEPYDLTDYTARFRCERADGDWVSDDSATVDSNVITYVMDSSVNAVSGTIYTAYFQILQGDTIIDSTGNMTIRVLTNGLETGDPAPGFVSELNKFLEGAQKQIDDAIASIPGADTITNEDIDEVIAGRELTNPNRTLTTSGLAYLWSKIEAPDLTGYATEKWVSDELEKTEKWVSDELENYVSKTDLDVELGGYATTQELESAVSGLVNSPTVQNMIDMSTKHFFNLADGENMPAGVDANDYNQPGTYTCLTDGASADIVNAPTNEYKFRMYVTGSVSGSGNAVGQLALIDDTDNNIVHAVARVTQNGSVWSSWLPVGGETLKLTAEGTQTINSNLALGVGFKLLGTSRDDGNAQYELIGLGEYTVDGEPYEQIEVGSTHKHLNANTDSDDTYDTHFTVDTEGGTKQVVAYKTDIPTVPDVSDFATKGDLLNLENNYGLHVEPVVFDNFNSDSIARLTGVGEKKRYLYPSPSGITSVIFQNAPAEMQNDYPFIFELTTVWQDVPGNEPKFNGWIDAIDQMTDPVSKWVRRVTVEPSTGELIYGNWNKVTLA